MALALLTRLPVTRWLPDQWQDKHQGLSALWYPAVGILLAILLYLCLSLLPTATSSLLSSVLVVCLWVVLTGALHLDGLADSVDAAFAAHRISGARDNNEHQKILSIFKDPSAGPMSVVAIVLVLLIKVTLLSELLSTQVNQLFLILVLSLTLPRALALLLIITTPYARPEGIGHVLVKHTPVSSAVLVLLTIALITLILMPLVICGSLLVLLGLLFFLWRKFWLLKIGGFVGDCIGALIELGEVFVLLVLCFAYM